MNLEIAISSNNNDNVDGREKNKLDAENNLSDDFYLANDRMSFNGGPKFTRRPGLLTEQFQFQWVYTEVARLCSELRMLTNDDTPILNRWQLEWKDIDSILKSSVDDNYRIRRKSLDLAQIPSPNCIKRASFVRTTLSPAIIQQINHYEEKDKVMFYVSNVIEN